MRRPQLTRERIEQKLQVLEDEMLNASLVRDEATYYEAYEERGALRNMLEEFESDASQDDRKPEPCPLK
jgi:hypothetical protein